MASKQREIIVESVNCRMLKITRVRWIICRGIGSNPCDKCSKTFSSRQYLIGHMKIEHEKQLDFECSTCGKKVGSKKRLRNHVFSCHSQVTCEICDKEIANPYDLKRHKLAVHKDTTGAWLCESCPKSAFFTKSSFNKHMKNKH